MENLLDDQYNEVCGNSEESDHETDSCKCGYIGSLAGPIIVTDEALNDGIECNFCDKIFQ